MGILDLLYPRELYCISCGAIIDKGSKYSMCNDCLHDLHFRIDDADGVMVCMEYGIYERDMLLRYKYRGEAYLGKHFGDLMFDRLIASEDINFDFVVPVPVFKRKLRERGYNQCKLMAIEVARKLGVPCADALLKLKHDESMSKLDTLERAENVRGSFAAAPGAGELLFGKKVLLIDDIFTTGATINECVKALNELGVSKVKAMVLASNYKGDDKASKSVV